MLLAPPPLLLGGHETPTYRYLIKKVNNHTDLEDYTGFNNNSKDLSQLHLHGVVKGEGENGGEMKRRRELKEEGKKEVLKGIETM